MVKFRKTFRNYGPGEIAGFSKQHEAWLLEKRIAERFVPPAKEPDMAKSQTAGTSEKDPGKPQTRQTTVGPQTRK